MQLPISAFSAGDVMRAARRCRMDLSAALAESFSVDAAFAYIATAFASLPEANCVELTAPLAAGQVDAISAEFARRGGRCVRWTALQRESELAARGAIERECIVSRLDRWMSGSATGDAMILQSRAAAAKTETLLRAAGRSEAAARAALLHIDNSHDEWLIGLQGGHAIAGGAILISGDAGLLHDAVALPGGEAVFAGVLDRLFDYAARAGVRHVLTCACAGEAWPLRDAGFIEAGRWFEYVFDQPAA